MKNRMREIRTSGSVRDGGGDVPIYSAVDLSQCIEPGDEASGNRQAGESTGEAELTIGEGGAQLLEEQVPEAAGEHADRQEEAGWAGDPACLVGRDAAAGDDTVQVRVVTPTPTIP